MKHGFWFFIFNVVWASILGHVIAAINDGSRIDGVIIGLIFLVWFELKDDK